MISMNQLMTSLILIVITGSTAIMAHAAPPKRMIMSCARPGELSGVKTNVNGILNLIPFTSDVMNAAGKLTVEVIPLNGHPHKAREVRVIGQVNSVLSYDFAQLKPEPSDDDEVAMIYMDFSDSPSRSNSYVELSRGARHIMNCRGRILAN